MWLENLSAGTLEFDYRSCSLRSEKKYRLDLANPVDNAICLQNFGASIFSMLSAHDSEAEVTMRVAEQARGAAMSFAEEGR